MFKLSVQPEEFELSRSDFLVERDEAFEEECDRRFRLLDGYTPRPRLVKIMEDAFEEAKPSNRTEYAKAAGINPYSIENYTDSMVFFDEVFHRLEEVLFEEHMFREGLTWEDLENDDELYYDVQSVVGDTSMNYCWWSSYDSYEIFAEIMDQMEMSAYGDNEWVLYQGAEWKQINPAQEDLSLKPFWEVD